MYREVKRLRKDMCYDIRHCRNEHMKAFNIVLEAAQWSCIYKTAACTSILSCILPRCRLLGICGAGMMWILGVRMDHRINKYEKHIATYWKEQEYVKNVGILNSYLEDGVLIRKQEISRIEESAGMLKLMYGDMKIYRSDLPFAYERASDHYHKLNPIFRRCYEMWKSYEPLKSSWHWFSMDHTFSRRWSDCVGTIWMHPPLIKRRYI
jgi:hypothetical protein